MPKSIVINLRFPTSQLSYGIQAFLNNKECPNSLPEILKTIYATGLETLLTPEYKNYPPTTESQAILNQLTKQKQSPSKNLKLMPTTPQPSATINQPPADPRLAHIKDPGILRQASNVISAIDAGIAEITDNLNSDNENIAKITALIYYPVKDTMSDKDLIEAMYNKHIK